MADAQTQTVTPPSLDDMRTMAQRYLVPVTDETLDNLSKGAQPLEAPAPKEGEPPAAHPAHQNFEDYLRTVASGLYPTFAPQIQAGMPTAYLLEPYRQVAKQVLGNQYEPNFQTDIKARAALEGARDKDGKPVPMTLAQWQTYLKSDPHFGWLNSDEGQRQMADMKVRLVAAMKGQ